MNRNSWGIGLLVVLALRATAVPAAAQPTADTNAMNFPMRFYKFVLP